MPLGANKAAIFGVAGVSTGDVVLLSTLTATSDTVLSFTSGIDSTYGEYIFRWYNVNPETDNAFFQFQANATDSTSYDEYITSSLFIAYANEGGSDTALQYVHDAGATDYDQAQGQAYQQLCTIGNGADESAAGELHLFNPASTTYAKHFYSTASSYHGSNYARSMRVSGYLNTTTAIDDIQFKMSAGDWDGKIKMWGVK